jgi:hypothetical protein
MAKFNGPSMDLANMRSLGLTKIDVYCQCGRNPARLDSIPGQKQNVKWRPHPDNARFS